MTQTPGPRWLRERLESGNRFPERGAWKRMALLAGVVLLLGAVLLWLWLNLANFR